MGPVSPVFFFWGGGEVCSWYISKFLEFFAHLVWSFFFGIFPLHCLARYHNDPWMWMMEWLEWTSDVRSGIISVVISWWQAHILKHIELLFSCCLLLYASTGLDSFGGGSAKFLNFGVILWIIIMLYLPSLCGNRYWLEIELVAGGVVFWYWLSRDFWFCGMQHLGGEPKRILFSDSTWGTRVGLSSSCAENIGPWITNLETRTTSWLCFKLLTLDMRRICGEFNFLIWMVKKQKPHT